MQTRLTGFVVAQFDDNNLEAKGFRQGAGIGNLPEDQVLSMAEDLDGEMWLGTLQGLVVCYAPQNIFDGGNYDAQPVLFEEDGVVQRLLGSEQVTAIAVDGANKKWFGTQNAGVFYTSEDGTETIYHFTRENSPLLSNGILDITIDNESGEVFFGTAEGIVSFRNAATTGNDDFVNVYAYPNPVRPDHNGPIFIRGLATNAQVKITDVAGNIVYETVAEGGQAIWYGTNLNGDRVASGVYIANMNNDDGSLRAVTKILIIN
jgi:ligand-binding sensor domain-containing protein